MSGKKLSGVMIGAGFFAGFHAQAWGRSRRAAIRAVADLDRARAEAFARQWNIPRAYDSAEEMIADEGPEFVDIVTRPEAHLGLARLAVECGAHVICQKPLAPTWRECRQMVDLCKSHGVRLVVHENWRWQPWYRQMKMLADAGQVGRPFHYRFTMRSGDGRGEAPYPVQPYFRQMEKLLVYETAVHFLDTFRYLGGEIESLCCHIQRLNPAISGEDYAVIQARFAGGAGGVIDANRFNGPNPPSITMGEFLLEGGGGVIRLADDGSLWITRQGEEEREHQYDWPQNGYKGDSVFATQEHLAACLLSGDRSESDGEDYLQTVAAVRACYKSAATGEAVQLP